MDETRGRPGWLERSVENLVTVVASVLPAMRRRELHGGVSDALTAFLAYVVAAIVGARMLYGSGFLDFATVTGYAGLATLSVAFTIFALMLLRRGNDLRGLAVGLVWAMALGTVLAAAVYYAADVDGFGDWILFGVLPAFLPAAVLLLARVGPLSGVLATLAFVTPGMYGALEHAVAGWLADPEEQADYELVDPEAVYAVQRDLLEGQASFAPGDPDRVEMFAVLGAGYPYEGVFAREVRAVGDLIAAEMGAGDRVMRLINDDAAPTDFPLMNRTNLRRALALAGEAMDGDDLLFLFLTSHGRPGAISASFYPVITRDLRPEDVSAALDEAGIGNAVIVISACYSGSFVEELAAPNRLILTAARADRVSFGCSDTAEWTDWGRAFFVEAWPMERDPRVAAHLAQEIVARREAERKLEASEPQIVEGAEIGPVIDRWLATLD